MSKIFQQDKVFKDIFNSSTSTNVGAIKVVSQIMCHH